MSSASLSPSPHDHTTDHVFFVEQRELRGVRGTYAPERFDLFIRAFRDALGSVCHRFGIYVSDGYVSLTPIRYRIYLEIAAGEWHATVKIAGRRDGRPIDRTCREILRLALRDIEKLG